KDLVEKYKIDVNAIQSLDDLDAVFQTIKDNEPSMSPLGRGLSGPMDVYQWYDKMGDKYGVLPGYDNGLKLDNLYETQEYESTVNKMRSWFKAGYINKDAATSQVNDADMVKAGKAFSYFVNNKTAALDSEMRASGRELVVAPLMKETYSTTSEVLTGVWTISANSAKPERAMMFMNLMYSDPAIANLLQWGIKDKHYVLNAENTVEFPAGVDSKTVAYSNQAWLIGNPLLTYPFKTEGADKWILTKEANATAIKSKALGFSFNSEPVKNEMTALKNVTDEFAKGLESGALDPASVLPEFRAKLKSAGIDKVIAEKQKQLDAWAATQK
ncbi:ABC transporter substrate-binding protein, partial [Paenibacillus sp. FSL H7-0326]